MKFSGLVAEKFCYKVKLSDTSCDKLKLSPKFVEKYASRLPVSMHFRLRNGYNVPVEYDRVRGFLKGVFKFYKAFDFEGGKLLMFEYLGHFNFNVYILGLNGSELVYRRNFHPLQECYPPMDTIGCGGWRIRYFTNNIERSCDEIAPPEEFLDACEFALTDSISYFISNGKKLSGSYCRQSRKLKGLRGILPMLGVSDIRMYNMLMFAYDGHSVMTISVFDESLYEIVIPGTPLSIDGSAYFPSVGNYFEIKVEVKHMSNVVFVVEIYNDFKWLVNKWGKCKSIKVYSGDCCWMLDIRKRDDYYCYTIEDGWKIFRDCLKLNVGDSCVFECGSQSYDHFSVRVVTNEFDEEE